MRSVLAIGLALAAPWLLVTAAAHLADVSWSSAFLVAVLLAVMAFTVVFAVSVFYALISGAPYVGASHGRVAVAVRLAALQRGERLVDLGSGDGRILRAAARQGAIAEGWEISPLLWAWSELHAWLGGFGTTARTRLGDFWGQSVADAQVISLYLLPQHMSRMRDKLARELRPGSRVVSIAFAIPGWAPSVEEDGVRLYILGEANNAPKPQ
jgi:hypothetical protein